MGSDVCLSRKTTHARAVVIKYSLVTGKHERVSLKCTNVLDKRFIQRPPMHNEDNSVKARLHRRFLARDSMQFCRSDVATSCDFIAILEQSVSEKR